MGRIGREFVHAARALLRDGGPVGVAVGCLALAMAAAVTILAVADAVVFRPLPCPAPDRLVIVSERHPQRGLMAVRPANFADWQRATHIFTAVAPAIDVSVSSPDSHRHLHARLVGVDFFHVWGVEPRLGRSFAADDYRTAVTDDFFGRRGASIVIGNAYWYERFGGDPAAVGRVIRLDSSSYRIVGVMPASFAVVDESDVWIPWIVDAGALAERRFHYFPIVARLRAGVTMPQAQQDLAAVYRTLAAENPEDRDWTVDVARPRQLLLGRTPAAITMLLMVVCLVLLIASANVSHILIARGIRRRKEIGVRLALGASRFRLVLGASAEASIIGAAATILALALASAAIRFVSIAPAVARLPFAYVPALTLRVFAFTVATALLTVAIFAIGPAWLESRVDPAAALRSSAICDVRRHRPRSALIIIEVALGLTVVVLTTLAARSLLRLMTIDPGGRVAHVLTMRLELDDGHYARHGESARFFDRVSGACTGIAGRSWRRDRKLPSADEAGSVVAFRRLRSRRPDEPRGLRGAERGLTRTVRHARSADR